MNRKRILILILSSVLLLWLSACGQDKKAAVSSAETSAVSSGSAGAAAAVKTESAAGSGGEASTKSADKTGGESKAESADKTGGETKAGSAVETKSPDDGYITAESELANFSFDCKAAYEYRETEDGQVQVFLVPGEELPCLTVNRIYDGRNAIHVLKEDAAEIADTYKDHLTSSPSDSELIDVDGRDLYRIRCEYTADPGEVTCVEYAEDYEDGTVVRYKAIYPPEDKELSEEAIDLALHTIWVGELDESLTAAALTEAPKETGKISAGRWTLSQKELPNGNIEFCIDDCVIMEVPGSWKEKAFWSDSNNYLSFYHKASYDKSAKEGYLGGCLFSIVYYTDESYQGLPSYDYIGPSADGGHYVMAFPTDLQGYMEDEKIREEWDIMYEEVEYIRDHVYSMVFS